MSKATHVKSLNAKHAEIEETIAQEEHRPNPDSMRLMRLKKEKLMLKDRISHYASPA